MQALFHAHSHWRYIIFLAAAVALLTMFIGWFGKRSWTSKSKKLALMFPIVVDIQFLTGIILWIIEKRWTGGDPLRSWEHPVTMVFALALAHIGFKKAKTEEEDLDKFKKAAIFYCLSLALICLGVFRVTMQTSS